MDYGILDGALRSEPEVFGPWYVLAIKELSAGSASEVPPKGLKALADSRPLYAALLA